MHKNLQSNYYFLQDKSKKFFTEETNKEKFILLRRYSLEIYIFVQNNKNCKMLQKSELINEVACEER